MKTLYANLVCSDYFHADSFLLCEKFVERVLGKTPQFIKIVYSTKNPKRKGFMRVRLSYLNEYDDCNVYVNGRLVMKDTCLFIQVEEEMEKIRNPKLGEHGASICYVKITEISQKTFRKNA